MNFALLGGYPHDFAAAPSDRPHVAVDDTIRLYNRIASAIDFLDRPTNLEVEPARRRYQTLGVFSELEDDTAIDTLAFEDAACVVKSVGQDMYLRIAPRNEFAVEPDLSITIVKRNKRHVVPPFVKFRSAHPLRSGADGNVLHDVTLGGIYVNVADLKSGFNQLFLREEELRRGMELLFFAYRDFAAEPDGLLTRHKFGRAHHRVIYFVGRYPGISVTELLNILKITKQSLSRVLGQLVREGVVLQKPGPNDRRQRRLELTAKGIDIEDALTRRQRERFARAFRNAGADAVEGFRQVLLQLVNERDQTRFRAPQ